MGYIKLALLGALVSAGCGVWTDPYYDEPYYSAPAAVAPAPAPYVASYRVAIGAGVQLYSGELGYAVTTSGGGSYRVAWTDTNGSAAEFHGSLITDGVFDSRTIRDLSGYSNIVQVSANQIDFDSVPGYAVDGIDAVTTGSYIELLPNVYGAPYDWGTYFTDAISGQVVTSSEYDLRFFH